MPKFLALQNLSYKLTYECSWLFYKNFPFSINFKELNAFHNLFSPKDLKNNGLKSLPFCPFNKKTYSKTIFRMTAILEALACKNKGRSNVAKVR